MVSREDVVAAYRLILGREPESEEVVDAHVNHTASLAELREGFFKSPEFLEQNTSGIMVGRHYVGPPMTIDTSISRGEMTKMLSRVEQVWQSYGAIEPYWSVLTLPEFKLGSMSPSAIENFYRTGEDNLQTIRAFFARNHESISTVKHVLEFGCGIGRSTFALTKAFPSVAGVDISSKHLEYARHRGAQLDVRNVDFVCIRSMDELDTLPMTDLLYSVIVLQHNPPPVMKAALKTLLAKVRKGGFALFQIPTYKVGYSFDASSYLDSPSEKMEMHVLEARSVFSTLKQLNFDVLEVHEDHCVGSPAFISQTFFARR